MQGETGVFGAGQSNVQNDRKYIVQHSQNSRSVHPNTAFPLIYIYEI